MQGEYVLAFHQISIYKKTYSDLVVCLCCIDQIFFVCFKQKMKVWFVNWWMRPVSYFVSLSEAGDGRACPVFDGA